MTSTSLPSRPATRVPTSPRETARAGGLTVSVDSTINRAHQHATNRSRVERPAGGLTGGGSELHDPWERSRR